MPSLVRYDFNDAVATITLDSPHNRNALSGQLVNELIGALARARSDQGVRAVVLTHTGRVFCAGADLAEAGSRPMADSTRAIMSMLTAVIELDKPVIAAVTGHVRAGGMGIVGAADISVATETASFAFTEARIGLAPAVISLTTLDVMDPRAAGRYYLTGEVFDASAAAAAGLLSLATATEDLDSTVRMITRQIRETSPQGSRETKRLLTARRRRDMADRSDRMAELSARLFASDEAQEGIRSFLERRVPAWRDDGR